MDELTAADEHLKAVCGCHERDLKAIIAKLDLEGSLLSERSRKLNEKKLESARVNGNPKAVSGDLIEINAGGTIVPARRSTLTQFKGTRLEAVFSGRWDKELQRDSRGRIFLDVNPLCFQAIVDCLNEMAISTKDNPSSPPSVDEEHENILMHQLELFGLLNEMPNMEFSKSNIIRDEDHVTLLHSWLKEDDSDGKFHLLYCASRDGFDGKNFHSKCDNNGCTISIIETVDGFVVGGYSNTPWESPLKATFHSAKKAFLFALCGKGISSPCKMKLTDQSDTKAVYHSSKYGPSFGKGDDLHVDGANNVRFKPGCSNYESGQITHIKETKIKEMEVFEVRATSKLSRATLATQKTKNINQVQNFREDLKEAINRKQESLLRAEAEMLKLENSFEDEHSFIASFASGDSKDVIVLNVGGTVMASKRSTLLSPHNSVLAQQFDDSKWTEQGSKTSCVKGWTPDDVCAWAEDIEGIQEDIGIIFKENGITGCELLALNLDVLKMMGIERPGTLGLLLKEIKALNQEVATVIEHSQYCFGKILDYLRLKQLYSQGFAGEPALPVVVKSQKKRFEKVVKHYFPGETSKFILG